MKRAVFIVLLAIAISACGRKEVEANYDIIPLPQEVVKSDGRVFLLNPDTKITYTQGQEREKLTAEFLARYIEESTGMSLKVTDSEVEGDRIALVVEEATEGNGEGYKIEIDNRGVNIVGHGNAGLFYGIQAFRKFIPVGSANSNVWFSGVKIEDYPRFAYRGMMLDVSRHFSSVDFVKRYIDILALHNINKFHLHLTEDQGWRIEIKKYPKLTEIGSQRKETIKGFVTGEFDGTPHGGFYTQDQLREIVKYAQDRFIEIIPEVDLPGHMLAALASYPELGCTGGPYEVAPKWGIHSDVLCAGNDFTYQFLEDIFNEIIEIFPSEYIHIGGDECPKTKWKACPKCQAKIKALGLKDDAESSKETKLQSHMTHHLDVFLQSKGRKLIGWDEIIEGGLAPNATVMSWRGDKGGEAAAKLGRDVIMCPSSHLYFDYYQTDNTATEPAAFPEVNSIEEVYSYNPIPASLTAEEAKKIIGLQANLWMEQINSDSHREYMTLPRLAALAEVQWSNGESRDYKNFFSRLINLVGRYSELGYNYCQAAFEVKCDVKEDRDARRLTLGLSTPDNALIYYTLDGTEPSVKSLKYSEPIVVAFGDEKILKAKAIRTAEYTNGNLYVESFSVHKGIFKKVELGTEISKYFYPPRAAEVLLDGRRGNDAHVFGNPESWVGFGGKMSATIDLGEVTDVASVTVGVTLVPNTKKALFKVSISGDGKVFEEVYSRDETFNAVADLEAKINKKAKFLKVEISTENYGHVLVDEIFIR